LFFLIIEEILHPLVSMIIYPHQTITLMTIAITIALVIQMTVHHLRTQVAVIAAVVVTKKPFHLKGLFSNLR
jgi:hypothetical protein